MRSPLMTRRSVSVGEARSRASRGVVAPSARASMFAAVSSSASLQVRRSRMKNEKRAVDLLEQCPCARRCCDIGRAQVVLALRVRDDLADPVTRGGRRTRPRRMCVRSRQLRTSRSPVYAQKKEIVQSGSSMARRERRNSSGRAARCEARLLLWTGSRSCSGTRRPGTVEYMPDA